MMNAAPDPATNDPLGYQRFALTESAYDLITSLTGIYARLSFSEEKSPEPDVAAIAEWNNRADHLQEIIHTNDWSDLAFLEQLISDLTAEYRANTSLESNGQTTNASANPRPVSAI
ncbi:hypothetical protein J2I47_22865 [Fibrella sp. HMF5335]|uniref:Uncharacterized protein n=1 Tax=Fibrella rubiginis TaxID=2817060 RepID=A0A939GHZ8_9BACT|nr:hypothetical protein [Fibrella rubiginis]MBO0939409.1 hypothetical protein [Fibrella rubiginis]